MKKMLAWLLSLSMLLAMVPAVSAEGDAAAFTVGDAEYSFAEDATGDGWSYDAESKTMTMDGLTLGDFEQEDYSGIDFAEAPDGFNVTLADGSVNRVYSVASAYEHDVEINGNGTLEFNVWLGYGGIVVNSGTVSGRISSSDLIVNGGVFNGNLLGSLYLNDGDVTLGSVQYASEVVVNGGTLTTGELCAYSYEQHGGTVKASYMINGNGANLSDMRYILDGGRLILDNTEDEVARGAFICGAEPGSDYEQFRQVLSAFDGTMVDAQGNPLTLSFIGYDENWEEIEELPEGYGGLLKARLCNSDGTLAYYAEYRAPEEDDSAAFTIGEEEFSFNKDATGDGWSYDAESKTMTMDGLDLRESEEGLSFASAPKGFEIVLVEGSVNQASSIGFPEIFIGHTDDPYPAAISGSGVLKVEDAFGHAIVNDGTIEVGYWGGFGLTLNDGDVVVDSTKAFGTVEVNGGTLTAGELDTYGFTQSGGTVRAEKLTNCNGIDFDKMEYALTGGRLILENPDSKDELGVFNCVAYGATLAQLRELLKDFNGTMKDEDGFTRSESLIFFDADGEKLEDDDTALHDIIRARLGYWNGNPMEYAEFCKDMIIGENSYSFQKDASGDGWSYDADSYTLTLDGLTGEEEARIDVDLSAATQEVNVILKGESEYINFMGPERISDYEGYPVVFAGDGSLRSTIDGFTIIVNSGEVYAESVSYANFVVNGGVVGVDWTTGSLTINGGEANVVRTKASQSVVVNGGVLNIEHMDTYSYEQYGGTVNAASMSNCNGTDIDSMKYVLNGGTFILEGIDGEVNPDYSPFGCIAYGDTKELEQVLCGFASNLVGRDGKPVIIRYESVYAWLASATIYNSDGTVATYVEYRSTGPCQHEASWLRSDDDGHWSVCGKCGGDMEDTRAAHDYTSYGPVDYCDCGHLTTDLEISSEGGSLYDEDVTEEIVQLGLKMWLGEAKMASQIKNTIDYDQEGITLEKIARLQLIAQGEEVPESFAAFGMTYRGEKGADTFSAPENLSGSWGMVKVFILDPVTFAPLTAPIEIAK